MRHFVLSVFVALVTLLAVCAQSDGQDMKSQELLPPSSSPKEAAVSLQSLEELALQNNPTLVQAGAQVRISSGKAFQAGLKPNPQVGYVADQIGAEGTAGEMQGMFFEQEIVTGGKLQLSREKYIQETRQAEIQVAAQRCRILYGVRLAYYEALAASERLKVQENLFANANEISATLNELVNVGQANSADVLQAKIESRRSSANIASAKRRAQGSYEALSAMIGVPNLEITSLDGKLDVQSSEKLDREASLNNVLQCSPDIRFARAEVRRDEIALARERREPIPNVLVRGETGYNFETENTVAGVEVGLNVPLFDRNQGTIQQARGEVTRAQAEVARLELTLRRRFAEVFADYEASYETARTYRDELLPEAEKVESLYAESFKQRRAAWPQVLDAQRQYYRLYEEYLTSVLETRRAETQITFLLVEDGLAQPPEPTPGGHQDATPKPR